MYSVLLTVPRCSVVVAAVSRVGVGDVGVSSGTQALGLNLDRGQLTTVDLHRFSASKKHRDVTNIYGEFTGIFNM